jgi:hypothetical protein
MPRYLVERDFQKPFFIPADALGAKACGAVIENNLVDQVTWVHSYVSANGKKTYCIYDGPTPEAIRSAASRCKLPVGRITEVRVLDPFFYLDLR